MRDLTGETAARRILAAAKIHDVQVIRTHMLESQYDPRNREIRLSRSVATSTSVVARSIAAHEVGHAIQHKQSYGPFRRRMAITPLTKIAAASLPILLLSALIFRLTWLMCGVAVCYLILLAFQLATLPVEFDASRRAKKMLIQMEIVRPNEIADINRTLSYGALTYVVAIFGALANLFRASGWRKAAR